jgi:hypothetical protein
MNRKKRKSQQTSPTIDKSFTTPNDSIIVGDLVFDRRGCLSVREMIAYETAINDMADPTIEYMVLALEISEDLSITHREAIDLIERCKFEVVTELIGYADRVKAIASTYSDHSRKKALIADFITCRCNVILSDSDLLNMGTPDLQKIYDFLISEFNQWQPAKPLDLGKQSEI